MNDPLRAAPIIRLTRARDASPCRSLPQVSQDGGSPQWRSGGGLCEGSKGIEQWACLVGAVHVDIAKKALDGVQDRRTRVEPLSDRFKVGQVLQGKRPLFSIAARRFSVPLEQRHINQPTPQGQGLGSGIGTGKGRKPWRSSSVNLRGDATGVGIVVLLTGCRGTSVLMSPASMPLPNSFRTCMSNAGLASVGIQVLSRKDLPHSSMRGDTRVS